MESGGSWREDGSVTRVTEQPVPSPRARWLLNKVPLLTVLESGAPRAWACREAGVGVSLRPQHLLSPLRSNARTKAVKNSSQVPPEMEWDEHLGLAPIPCLLSNRSALTSPPQRRRSFQMLEGSHRQDLGSRSEGGLCQALPFTVCSVT